MHYESKTIDITRARSPKDIDKILEPFLEEGYDVKAMTKDYVIVTKQTAN